MEIKFFADITELEQLSLEMQFQKVKEAGYDGIQLTVEDVKNTTLLKELLDTYQLQCIAQINTSGINGEAHKNSFKKQLDICAPLNPVVINALTGKDYFSFGENVQILNEAIVLEKTYGIHITHEMYRGRFSFAAHMMERYLSLLPNLKIAANFSEWCTVAGTYLEDQQEAVSMAVKKSYHIKGNWHGTSSGKVRENQKYADEKFLYWWHRIIQYQDHKIAVLPITVPYKSKFLVGGNDLKLVLGTRNPLLS